MEELQQILKEFINENLYQIILSNSKDTALLQKIKIRPVLVKDELLFQISRFEGTKVFHENLCDTDLVEKILFYMGEIFKQLELESSKAKITVLISKNGKCTIKKKLIIQEQDNETKQLASFSHNRKKKYVLEEGTPISFLVELGVLTKEGKVINAKYDKWKQINRYLEFIEDILPSLPKDRILKIIDFGCGKSYLTFAMYYYLKEINGYQIEITGLDLKDDVIRTCNDLAEKCGFDHLHFLKGDIAAFQGEETVDMVVTLHACDTATDYAIYKAINWNAKVIFSVPCCQHEVNRQIKSHELQPVLKYGLIKERLSALLTDAIRANLLEESGYDTQILEFIDMEHTPKNILIRAVKRETNKKTADTGIADTASFFSVNTTLQKLLESKD